MASPTIPASGSPTATARRTRKTDLWTTVFFVLTGALGVWSQTLIALTVLAIVVPAYEADDDAFELKSLGAVTIALIAIEQAFTMGAAMGKVPKLGLSMRVLMRAHRYAGRIGLTLAGVVAFLCWLGSSGVPTPEGMVHGALASTGFLAIALKLALLKWRPALAFRVAPWLGSYAALAFILVVVSSLLGDGLFEDLFEDDRGDD